MNSKFPTIIVSGFPGIGKTSLTQRFPRMFRDLESSEYHWVKDNFGNRIVNPKWPDNYVEAIKNLSNCSLYLNVFVSSHQLIREKMRAAGIRYTVVYPEDTPEMKKVMMERYEKGKRPESFIELMDEHFSEYVKSMMEDRGAVSKVPLSPRALNEWGT